MIRKLRDFAAVLMVAVALGSVVTGCGGGGSSSGSSGGGVSGSAS